MSKAGERTSLGMEQNLEGLLCYVLGWITGLIFLILENKNKFVRFHAVQSIVVFGAVNIVCIVLWILSWIPWIGILFMIINGLVGTLALVLWVVLMVKAYQGTKYRLPVAGKIAARQSR